MAVEQGQPREEIAVNPAQAGHLGFLSDELKAGDEPAPATPLGDLGIGVKVGGVRDGRIYLSGPPGSVNIVGDLLGGEGMISQDTQIVPEKTVYKFEKL